MRTNMNGIHRHGRGALCMFAALSLILPGAALSASAQGSPNWAVTNVYNCWAGWNNNFLYPSQPGIEWFSSSTNGSGNFGHVPGLWQEANMLQVVEDAYWYGYYNYQTFHPAIYISEINAVCAGITNQFPRQWMNASINDTAPNDDLLWTTVAFTRAFELTGNQTWLKEATNAFGIVWNRAQINGDAADFGLGQSMNKNGTPTNADSPVNFNGVIAGYWLADAVPAHASFYLNCAGTIYDWATNNSHSGNYLCNPSTGKVRDSVSGPVDYTYNYGVAIWAAALEQDANTCTNIVQYLATKFGGNVYTYNGVWTDPGSGNMYSNLPDYNNDSGNYGGGYSTTNNAGYNGIAFRGLGIAWPLMTSWQQNWAQEEVEAGFYHRNDTTQLMWGDLLDHTPLFPGNGSLYSWDCSSELSGMFNIPE